VPESTNEKRLELRTAAGELLYMAPRRIDGVDVTEFYSYHVRWSQDSKLLAIAGGFPKLTYTYLFAWDGARFEQISMPLLAVGYDNPWIVPEEWLPDHRLKLRITGPHAGKARDGGYAGTATIAVDLAQKTTSKIKERIK
jgi:hypothetical protein